MRLFTLLTCVTILALFVSACEQQAVAAPAEVGAAATPAVARAAQFAVAASAAFPSTALLDNFDRVNGAIGANWSGTTGGYSVVSNRLDVGSGGDIYWKGNSFGTDQEAYVTFTTIDAAGQELDLLLKVQSSSSWGSGVIEVWYAPGAQRAQVWTFTNAQNWVQRGADIPVTLVNGDQFGARATAAGQVEVYRNGALLATRDVTAWPYYAGGGYIGLWFIGASNAVLDDFGGGTVGAPGPTNTPTATALPPTATSTSAPTNTATAIPPTTNTPTATALPPSAISTPTPTNTATRTPTVVPSATATSTQPSTATRTPTATNSPTATSAPSNTPTATATTPSGSDPIFADGFESGSLTAWSSNSIDAGSLSVSAAAALVGSYGLQALINDNNVIYVTDDTPNAEPRYRARFYFDPNSIKMANGNAHYLLYGYTGASTVVLRVEFRFSSGAYQLRASLLNGSTTWTNTGWFTLGDMPHFIEIDWRAATAAGANNGGLTLWIDGTQRADLTGVANDARRIDRVRLGAVSGIDTGTRGTYYFDAFESRRQSYIGPVTGAPTPTPTGTPTSTTPAATPTATATLAPTITPTALPPSSATPTATATSTSTSTLVPTSSATLSPTATTASGSSVYFPIGAGSTDVIPHQLVRTSDDRVYLFANQQYSTRLWAYWTTTAGLPSAQADFAGSTSVLDGANLISVDAVYDGGSTVHVLVDTQAGLVKDYPFDLATNTFKPPLTLASDNHTLSGDYLGSSGVSGMVDQSGTLHVGYWSNGNHILHTAFTYDSANNLLTPVAVATQVDIASVAANHPAVAVSPVDNSLTVAWVSESSPAQILARTRTSAGVWGNVETVSAGPVWTSPYFGVNIDQGPSLVITSDGSQHLAYIENWDNTGNYGRVHYVVNAGTGWVDQPLGMWTHNPALAVNSAGGMYILGHGHPKNADAYGVGSPCLDMRDMCFLSKNGDGTWAAPQLLAGHMGASDSFDSSPSVKWGVVGWNRPETIELLFFSVLNGDYTNPTLYYARLP